MDDALLPLVFEPIDPKAPLRVAPIGAGTAASVAEREHYMHRRPIVTHAFGLYQQSLLRGVCIFGTPASHHLQKGACPSDPSRVIELNRLWVDDILGKNTESWFVSRCLKLMPPLIVVSYADTSYGYVGYIYRALNFHYAGWTDMERATPRREYVPLKDDLHSREAYRSGYADCVPRKQKIRYWITTGNRRERAQLSKLCSWPIMDWKKEPPPIDGQHYKRGSIELSDEII